MPSPAVISKSQFLSGLQCLRRLWWEVHEPEAPELVPDPPLQAVFDRGLRVGELARERFPGGILVDAVPSRVAERTEASRAALASGAPAVFEASVAAGGARADVDVGEGAPGRDARLEDGRSAAGERGPGRLGLHRDVRGIGVDEDAAGEPLPRQLADPVAAIEHRLQGRLGHELRGLGLVDFPPEPPEALQPREELGPMDDGRGGHSRKRTAARRVRSKPVATAVPGGGDQRLALVVFRLVRADGRFRFEAPGSPSQMTASTLLPSRSMTNAAYAA